MIQQICLIVEEYQMLENKSIPFEKKNRASPAPPGMGRKHGKALSCTFRLYSF